jgi:hypothetical protein
MQISEQELRQMVRDAIARHGAGANRGAEPCSEVPAPAGFGVRAHPSHVLFATIPSGDGDCIIEPTVRCNHCGYCKSYGH